MEFIMHGQRPPQTSSGTASLPSAETWAWWRTLCLGWLLVLLSTGLWAQVDWQPAPEWIAEVIDTTDTLSAAQIQTITAQLESIERQYGAQVVVLMLTTTASEDIAAYAKRVANTWEIGEDGLLFVIATNDRNLHLEVARGLQAAIPDEVAARIIEDFVVLPLRDGDYATAIEEGLIAIEAQLASDDVLPVPQAAPEPESAFSDAWLGWLFILWPVLLLGLPVL